MQSAAQRSPFNHAVARQIFDRRHNFFQYFDQFVFAL
jgi:hypothetical protein